VYKWTFKESEKKSQSSPNKGIIFSGSGKQTGDMMFVNGGYYLEDGLWDSVSSAAGIQFVKGASTQNMDGHWYDLNGRRLSEEPTKKGVYIYQGKKILK
jgi:alpha-amylase